jgi:ribosomal protein S18 acetylase RimI-like enzyme
MNFLWYMDAEATKIIPELANKGTAVDLWFLGVHPNFRGNKIANNLLGVLFL